MKKPLILSVLLLLALTLSAFILTQNKPEAPLEQVSQELSDPTDIAPNAESAPEFLYEIGPRFIATITKENLDKAFFVRDILPERANWDSHSVQDLHITLLKGVFEPTESCKGLMLNEAQMRLLKSANYSDNLKFIAHCKGKHEEMGNEEDYELAYFITVLPEHEAVYTEGKEAFISYLKEKSKAVISQVKGTDLQAGKIQFTVTTNGSISNVNLESTSGYPEVDVTLLELIRNAPGRWEPASNSKMMKVEQTLTFFFGMMGC
jgi:hypothetical protein